VIRLLAELGAGFDCASKAEIKQVLEQGVAPSRIIYAHPCKTRSYVRYAAAEKVKQMTFDNADELHKVKRLFPDAELFLRIMTDDSSSLCRLSVKFGAALDSTRDLLELAWKLDLNVVGVSFHVGSGASDPTAFLKAVQDSRIVFDQAADIGFNLKTLDVGGGFSSDSFESMASVLSTALDDYFPTSVRVIAEPGRFYVASAFTIATNVIARRTTQDPISKELSYMLYLNDGVYGNFSSIMFDHQHPVPHVLSAAGCMQYEEDADLNSYRHPRATQYSLWGPTCDGIDCISQGCCFEQTLDVGDWLYFKDMGGMYPSRSCVTFC
jgi:ornithine decarboxylase